MGKCTTAKCPHVAPMAAEEPDGRDLPSEIRFYSRAPARLQRKDIRTAAALLHVALIQAESHQHNVRSNQKNSCARVQSWTRLKDLCARRITTVQLQLGMTRQFSCLEAQTSKEFVPPFKAADLFRLLLRSDDGTRYLWLLLGFSL